MLIGEVQRRNYKLESRSLEKDKLRHDDSICAGSTIADHGLLSRIRAIFSIVFQLRVVASLRQGYGLASRQSAKAANRG
jgi:hypothetical protein